MSDITKGRRNLQHVEDLFGFEQKDKKARSVVWILVFIFWLSGLLGLFGNGPLSTTRIEGDGFYIEYDRFLRDETSTILSIFIEDSSSINPNDTVKVALHNAFTERVILENIVPRPIAVEARNNRLLYSFKVSGNGLITYNFYPHQTGSLKFGIDVQDNQLKLYQFVFF